jgi:hypothetical protein
MSDTWKNNLNQPSKEKIKMKKILNKARLRIKRVIHMIIQGRSLEI